MGCTSSRAEGNLEVGGDVQSNTSRLEAVYGHSLIINPSLGMYQEIHSFCAMDIDNVKINTSMMIFLSGMHNQKYPSFWQCTKRIQSFPCLGGAWIQSFLSNVVEFRRNKISRSEFNYALFRNQRGYEVRRHISGTFCCNAPLNTSVPIFISTQACIPNAFVSTFLDRPGFTI